MSPTSKLKSAISSNDNETVSKLLGEMDIEAVNRKTKNKTALHVACDTDNQEALDSLLAIVGIDVNVKDNTGWTPLHAACHRGNLQAVAKLLDRPEIDANSRSSYGSTPLHFACYRNLDSIVRKLLGSPGIDVDARDNVGDTPIMDCASGCRKDALSVMLDDPRVNLDVKNNDGKGLEEKVGASFDVSKEEKDTCLEMITKERMRRKKGEVGQEETSQARNIGRHIAKIEKINREILMEEGKSNKYLDIRKQKMEDLAKKNKEEMSLLEKNQRHEITMLQYTFAREDHFEQRYIARLEDHRDELTQEIEKLTNDAGNGASANERSKLEPITRSLECPVCMELMRPPRKIWMCRFTHVICEVCKDHLKAKGGKCPTCTTEPFTGRNYMAENLARTVFKD